MDKWEAVKESVSTRCVELESVNRKEIEEARRELLAEIETAKNNTILDEIRKVNGRLDKIEAQLSETKDED
jgi:hypothetical protein